MAQAVGSFGMAAGGVSGSLLAARLTGSTAAGALPAGALALGAAVTAPAITAVMRRRGRMAGLLAGYVGALGGAVAALVAARLGSALLLLAASVIFGAGTSTVMLTRYTVADLADPAFRGRALSRSLVVTTVGAVVAPNLLAPATVLASPWGLPRPAGLYVVSVIAFGTAAALLLTAGGGSSRSEHADERLAVHLLTQKGEAGGHHGPDNDARANDTGDVDDPGHVDEPGRRSLRRQAFLVLATANGVMVTIMTLAAVDLHAHGHDLSSVGLMVSLHVAAMFALSPIFGWVSDRAGPRRLAAVGAGLLVAVGAVGALGEITGMAAMTGLVMALGLGWNMQIVAGSALLIEAAPAVGRQALEGRAELAMGLAAGFGSLLGAAPLAALGGFSLVSAGAMVVSTVTFLHVVRRPRRRASESALPRRRRGAGRAIQSLCCVSAGDGGPG